MALVVFLRGVNVGGHRTFRPSVLAKSLKAHDVVNVGAAGTFVVRKPVSRAKFEEALRAKLPFETNVMTCEGREILALESDPPFGDAPQGPDLVRFVSVMKKAGRLPVSIPFALPSDEDWLVRVIAARGRFVFGEYRRHMKTIGHLSRLDRIFGATATTRNWNTIRALARVLTAARE